MRHLFVVNNPPHEYYVIYVYINVCYMYIFMRLTYLNSQHPNINFTLRDGKKLGSFPFDGL